MIYQSILVETETASFTIKLVLIGIAISVIEYF